MIIIPVYNKQLISDGKLYFQTDEFKKAGGRAVQGEKVVFVQNRYRQDRNEMTEDNYYPIGVSGEKFQNSPGLQHWASVKNLKTAAASYAAADNLSELQKQIDKKTTEAKSARTELVELEHQMKKVSELLLYAEQYRDNKPFQEKYRKSKDPDRYLRMHETQLILYDGAERMLRKMGLDPKSVNPAEIRADYEAMQLHKATLERTYKTAEKEAKALQQKIVNVEHFIGHDIAEYTQQQRKANSQNKTSRSGLPFLVKHFLLALDYNIFWYYS